MEKLSLNVLRTKFLEFFESKGHLAVPSFSLVPDNDPSILLINAGMTPLKPYFTGAKKPPSNRMASCQKCLRTLDIESVGITDRHGSYFEMLGNFSFGDYFKREAIAWAWEFFTEVLEIPEELLSPTVYLDDDEAYDIWTKDIGFAEEKVSRLGKEDNFWEHGIGPCGPCSEIFFDRGAKYGCSDPKCAPGCDCDRYIEVWNLVFTQFDKQENGEYVPLDMKNIDTGMGLERLACVMQEVDNLFEVDTIKSTLDKTCELADIEYKKDAKKDISIRLITDHVRSSVMLVSDGVIPSNEGRGYVLRRLLRRAARHGRLLGIKGIFMTEIVKDVIRQSGGAYPELVSRQEYIEKVIMIEEERFQTTVDQGIAILTNIIDEIKEKDSDTLDGLNIFKLHDTFGFPYELTEEIAAENNIKMDEEGFKVQMQKQKEMARNAQKAEDGSQAWGGGEEDAFEDVAPSVFTGYDNLTDRGIVLKIVKLGDMVEVALDKTPFYAESGGQVGDTGIIRSGDDFEMIVVDCIKTHTGVYVHKGKIVSGAVSEGDEVTCEVSEKLRKATERNHTATHILQFALQEVLGSHVAQAGSHVGPDRMRFDFTHFSAMTSDEVKKVEDIVNEKILDDAAVKLENMGIAEAREKGAMALFGEKYGDTVRVVSTGDFSIELCGGTHLEHTSSAGLFIIVSESGVAAGVRRIEALTGASALAYLQDKRENLEKVAGSIKSTDSDAPEKVGKLLMDLKTARKEINNLKKKAASGSVSNVLDNPEEINGTKIIVAEIKGADMNTLRSMCDAAREKYDDCVVLLGSGEGRISFAAAATKKAVEKGIHSGKIIGQVAKVTGGGGGGRPDMAQAGGKDASKLKEALEKGIELIGEVLK